MKSAFKCPGCGVEFGEMTDHGQSERKCEPCLRGIWAGGVPSYLPGKDASANFMDFLRQQAAQGIEKAKELLAKAEGTEHAVIDTDVPMLDDGKMDEPGTLPVDKVQ